MKGTRGLPARADRPFDPYRVCLGVPAERLPCTHYELLGISPGERDQDLIEAATVDRASRIRGYQLAYPEECTRLLSDIARALDTLADPAKRQAYDAQLEAASGGCAGEPSFGAGDAAPAEAAAQGARTRPPSGAPAPRGRESTGPGRHREVPPRAAGPDRCGVVLRVRPSRERMVGGVIGF